MLCYMKFIGHTAIARRPTKQGCDTYDAETKTTETSESQDSDETETSE